LSDWEMCKKKGVIESIDLEATNLHSGVNRTMIDECSELLKKEFDQQSI
jgi:hypothetical protein